MYMPVFTQLFDKECKLFQTLHNYTNNNIPLLVVTVDVLENESIVTFTFFDSIFVFFSNLWHICAFSRYFIFHFNLRTNTSQKTKQERSLDYLKSERNVNLDLS